MVQGFLRDHPELRLDDARLHLPADCVSPEGFVETYPHIHAMDGSFAARMVKSPQP
jgi:16S rRNA C967 or C1407 C5-methylase (RsmB/RsmF family)